MITILEMSLIYFYFETLSNYADQANLELTEFKRLKAHTTIPKYIFT